LPARAGDYDHDATIDFMVVAMGVFGDPEVGLVCDRRGQNPQGQRVEQHDQHLGTVVAIVRVIVDGPSAIHIANRASETATASVSIWAAWASRPRLPDITLPTTSTIICVASKHSTISKVRLLAPR
jgi:hypothetical protein